MEVNINITEGCMAYSYTINDKEWADLTDAESDDCDFDFVNDVCCKLIDEVKEQYQLPEWILECFYNGEYEACCTQQMFITLVKENKNVQEKWIGHCDECGDDIYNWKLKINI